jgi:hypothetical protein
MAIRYYFTANKELKDKRTCMAFLQTVSLISAVLLLASCNNNNEIEEGKEVNPEAVYLDYSITGEEDDGEVTCKFQFRMGGPEGTALVLNSPAKIELDGEVLTADSSKLGGAYYEIQKPHASFTGKHVVTYTDLNKKEFTEEFDFTPLSFTGNMPAVISRNDFSFQLEGLEPEDYITVVITDTVFGSDGIHQIDTVKDGRLVIAPEQLRNLANGPITVILSKETEKPLKNPTGEGGKITTKYSLRREFELKDTPAP